MGYVAMTWMGNRAGRILGPGGGAASLDAGHRSVGRYSAPAVGLRMVHYSPQPDNDSAKKGDHGSPPLDVYPIAL